MIVLIYSLLAAGLCAVTAHMCIILNKTHTKCTHSCGDISILYVLNMSRVLVFFHTCLFTLMTTEAVAKSIGFQFDNKEYWAEKPLNENVTLFRLVCRTLTCSAFSHTAYWAAKMATTNLTS